MSKNQVPIFPLRLPPDLRRWVKETAAKNRRPMNSEIILLIEAEQARQAEQRATRRATTTTK